MDMILFAYRLPPPVSPTTLPSVAKLHLKPQITHMYLLMSLKLNEYVFFFKYNELPYIFFFKQTIFYSDFKHLVSKKCQWQVSVYFHR